MDKKSFAKVYSALSKENITVKDSLKNIDEFLRILEKALLIDGQNFIKIFHAGFRDGSTFERKIELTNPESVQKFILEKM